MGVVSLQQAKVLWLRRVEGLTEQQAADQLGISQQAVSRLLAAGMRRLGLGHGPTRVFSVPPEVLDNMLVR